MRHFPARAFPARIESEAVRSVDALLRASRQQLAVSILQSVLCGALGFIAGIVLALGYLADAPAWLR